MEDSSSFASSANHLQDIVEFLEGIGQSIEELKDKINSLAAKYPVTAQEKRLGQIIQKIRRDLQERIAVEKLLRQTTLLSLEETSPSSSEETTESIPIPTPPQAVDYPVVLYNGCCLRRRTVDQVGKLGETLPRKKKAKIAGITVETLTNDKYDSEKRAREWTKELMTFSQNGHGVYNTEQIDSKEILPNAQAIVLDIGKINVKKGNISFFFFESQMGDLIISREKFSLSLKEYDQLRGYDPNERLEVAMKLAAANYEYWSSVYYKGLRSKEKDPMQQSLVKEYLRHYIKDPLNSKGLIFYYQIHKTSYNQQLQCQTYIGKCEGGSLVERLREIHEESERESPSLLKLALKSKLLYADENEMGDVVKKNVVLILDFGYPEEFVEKYKDRLDKGDRLSVLQKNYIEYFGARSPIGLN